MGNVIVTVILFIFFIGLLSLLIDCLYVTRKQNPLMQKEETTEATVILEDNFEVDLDNLYK